MSKRSVSTTGTKPRPRNSWWRALRVPFGGELTCVFCGGPVTRKPGADAKQAKEIGCADCGCTCASGSLFKDLRWWLAQRAPSAFYHLSWEIDGSVDFLMFTAERDRALPEALLAVRWAARGRALTEVSVIEIVACSISFNGSHTPTPERRILSWQSDTSISLDEAVKRATISYRKNQ